jgi:hypothetical protein
LFSVTPYRGVAFNNRVFCGNIEGPLEHLLSKVSNYSL